MLVLAFRNLIRQIRRTLLTLAAIVMGVVGITLSGGFVEDIFVQLREFTIHSQIGHLQIYREGYSTVGRRDPFAYLLEYPDPLIQRLQGWPEVSQVMKRVSFSGLANNGRSDYPVIGEGVEVDKEGWVGSRMTLIEGRNLKADNPFEILIGKGVARALKVKQGDLLTLLVNTPGGAINTLEFTVAGVFQTFFKDFDDRSVRISLGAAQDLLGTPAVHALVFALHDTAATEKVVDRLRAELPREQYEIKPWYELADFYQKTVDLYRRQFGVLQVIILIMVILSVANSVNMAIYERTGEFGTLMALGNKRGHIFRLVVLEFSLLGLLGAVIGVALGVGLAWMVSSIGIPMPPPPNSDMGYTAHVQVTVLVIVTGLIVGLLGTLLAALLPAWRVSRLPVVDALRSSI